MKNTYADGLLKKKKKYRAQSPSGEQYLREYKKWIEARSADPCWYYPHSLVKGKVTRLSHKDPFEALAQMFPWQRKARIGNFVVSTVFLMLPHGLFRDFYFETMVFSGDGGVAEIPGIPEQVRYRTKQRAMRGHRRMCRLVYKSLSKKV